MRVRTVVALATGAAAGAGAMYLFDPDHGPRRRREARRSALRQARQGAASAVAEGQRRAREMAVAAAAGYREARREVEVGAEQPPSGQHA
jgi:hypothetical protein